MAPDAAGARRTETVEQRLHRVGITRLGSPQRGFRYRTADGRPASERDRARIRALAVPPAWRDVRIAPSPRDRVQAIGRDQRGRLQYRYREAQAAERERDKLARIVRFVAVLPRLRRRVARDLRRRGLGRERVMAAIVRILGSCLLRPGSAAYAAQNGSFGIATLRPRHVRTRGATVVFDFPAKSGKRATCSLRDGAVARIVRELRALRGAELFRFEAPPRPGDRTGRRRFVDVRRRDVNNYLAEVTGERITAKDFRTWGGTLACASALARLGPSDGSAIGGRRAVTEALRRTADLLGNTPAVCRRSYVFAAVFDAYERGRTVGPAVPAIGSLASNGDRKVRRLERAVLELLRSARRRDLAR